MWALWATLFLVIGAYSQAKSSIITFPTSFTSFEHEKINPSEVKNRYQKGIDAVQSVAGLVHNLLLQETINFAAKNWVISPVSLAGVFAQLLMGSRGEIREVLNNALSLGEDRNDYGKLEVHRQLGNLLRFLQHHGSDDYVLFLEAAVFLQDEFPLKSSYRHALFDFYETRVLPVDFTGKPQDSLRKINEWVKNSTHGIFSDLFPSPPPSTTVSIMANVVYFKGAWVVPFDSDVTRPGMFFIDSFRKVRVDYMLGEQEILYGNTSDYQLIGLPFKGREVVLYILLPNGKFSTRVAMKQFDAIASSARLENVTLVIPKMKLTTTISVKDAIGKYLRKRPELSRRLGRTGKNFTHLYELEEMANLALPSSIPPFRDQTFDMSGASDDVRFKIDDIMHRVSIQLDERGTEAAAVTSTLVDHFGSDFILKVNRPFLFFVRHEVTLTHLFWGLVVDPRSS